MLVNFDILPDNSRIWIYAAKKKLTDLQQTYILNNISTFLQTWVAHNKILRSGIKILENRFIVIALDENENRATGCAIDALQNKIQEIESYFSFSLMNRLNVFCIVDGIITCISVHELASQIDDSEMLFYDLTVQEKRGLSNWIKPLQEGWCNNFL